MPKFRYAPGITLGQLREHTRLTEEQRELSFNGKLRSPGAPVDGMEAVLLRRMMADVARLVAREPGGRALLRLPPTGPIGQDVARNALCDAKVALDAFFRVHQHPDPDIEGWYMLEGDDLRTDYFPAEFFDDEE